MLTTLRAALSVLLLVGFYVVALAAVAGLGLGAVLAFRHGGASIGAKLALAALVALVGLVVAMWRVLRHTPEPPPGVVVAPHDAPELWTTVHALAAAARTRPPDEIRLVGDVNAAVSEDTRLLGLLPGTRRMYLGVPLLLGLDVAQLRSVLGHELGHYSHAHTRLGAVTYRGRDAIITTLGQTSGTLVGTLLRQYAKLYLLVSAAVSRRQELEADDVSVRVAGRDVAASALLEVPVLDTAWDFYHDAYLAPAWEAGLAPVPDAYFTGFRELLAARADEMVEMRDAGLGQGPGSRWDSHPPVPERVATIRRTPQDHGAVGPRDTRPAHALVPDARRLAARLAAETFADGGRRHVEWDELTAVGVATAEQRSADVVLRAAARMTDGGWASVATVLDVVERGRASELARHLALEPDGAGADARHPLVDPLRSVLAIAFVQAGVAAWQHSWRTTRRLVTSAGAVVDLDALATRAADPRTVDGVRDELRAAGVDPARAGLVEQRATAVGAAVLGGMANVLVGTPSGRAQHDVVLLDRGLVLVPAPRRTEGGARRLVTLLESMPVADLARLHRFVPLEEVRRATVRRRVPAKVELHLHDGGTLVLREQLAGEELERGTGALLVSMANAVVERATGATTAPVQGHVGPG